MMKRPLDGYAMRPLIDAAIFFCHPTGNTIHPDHTPNFKSLFAGKGLRLLLIRRYLFTYALTSNFVVVGDSGLFIHRIIES